MNNPGISVVVCTYNGENQLTNTFQHLFNQKQFDEVSWEIIVVDNNSTDRTSQIIATILNANETGIPIKHLTQPLQGKLAALKLGIENAQYKYLLICDDDNWLNENYLSTAYHFMETHPEIGILGGKGIPVNTSLLPDWILPHLHNYAAAEQWSGSADITHVIGSVYGAGMVIKKEIYDFVFKENWPLYLSAIRKGKMLLSGEDTEICYIARLLGHKIYYNSDLEFMHNFPQSKINQHYLLNLIYYFGYGEAILLPYTAIETNKNTAITKIIFLELYRLIRYDFFYLIKQWDLDHKKNIYRRYGFIKSLFINRNQIKSLSAYLKYKLNSAGSTPHI
ncbi:MAG: glycosyltransferase [Bacteroidota bacterium]